MVNGKNRNGKKCRSKKCNCKKSKTKEFTMCKKNGENGKWKKEMKKNVKGK